METEQTVPGGKGPCPCVKGPAARLTNKSKVFDLLRDAAVTSDSCGWCISSAALYLAAVVARDQLDVDLDEFLNVAQKIWDDVDSQRQPGQAYS